MQSSIYVLAAAGPVVRARLGIIVILGWRELGIVGASWLGMCGWLLRIIVGLLLVMGAAGLGRVVLGLGKDYV